MGPPLLRYARAVLAGRGTECARLDQLLAEARLGQSAVLVLRGELRKYVNVYVDGNDARESGGLAYTLIEADEVRIVAMLSGG